MSRRMNCGCRGSHGEGCTWGRVPSAVVIPMASGRKQEEKHARRNGLTPPNTRLAVESCRDGQSMTTHWLPRIEESNRFRRGSIEE